MGAPELVEAFEVRGGAGLGPLARAIHAPPMGRRPFIAFVGRAPTGHPAPPGPPLRPGRGPTHPRRSGCRRPWPAPLCPRPRPAPGSRRGRGAPSGPDPEPVSLGERCPGSWRRRQPEAQGATVRLPSSSFGGVLGEGAGPAIPEDRLHR